VVVLFAEYDELAWDLHYSLIYNGTTDTAICLNDEGFLNKDVRSIWGVLYPSESGYTPLHVNNLQLPVEYEIEKVDGRFLIKSIESVLGEVFFHGDSSERLVSSINWFDGFGKTYKKDLYNNYGFLFRSDTFVNGLGLVGSQFYSRGGEVLASWNHQTNSLVVGETMYPSVLDFYVKSLELMGYDEEGIIFDNLGLPLEVIERRNNGKENTLIFLEKFDGRLPENMNYIHSNPSLGISMYVVDVESYNSLSDKSMVGLYKLCLPPISDFGSPTDALITTETDEIVNTDLLVDSCRDTTFHIAAPTRMSERLLSLGDKPNVKLYPVSSRDEVKELFSKCGVFLDIAVSGTVFGANRLALQSNCLRLGYRGVSSGQYIPSESLFTVGYRGITNTLNYLVENPDKLPLLVTSQNDLLGIDV
jgi:glycosyltranferase